MAVKIISRMQHGKIYLVVLNWIFTLHYRKVKGEETGTHEHFRTTKELVRFFSFVVMSGKRLAWATCLGLAEMQLFCGQLFKLQKYKNQGGTSQFGIRIGYVTVVCFLSFFFLFFFTRNILW